MTHQLFSNDGSTTLASAINTTALSLTVTAGAGAQFPNPGANQFFLITMLDAATQTLTEIMKVTARSGDTFTVVRAQEGTIAQNWNVGDFVQGLVTAGTLGLFVQPDTIQATTNPIYPPLISTGATQTASGIWTTTGVPSNTLGNNGDYAFRSDGTSGNHIYFKAGGVWSALI